MTIISETVERGVYHFNEPHRLWSLWDMINASVTGLAPLIYQLSLYEIIAARDNGEGHIPIDKATSEQVAGWLRIATPIAADFEIKAAQDRIGIIEKKLKKDIVWDDLAIECRVLRQTLEGGLKGQLIYRYFDEDAAKLMRWKDDWSSVLEKFPSTYNDIFSAVDCWALGHGTASVFHSMRILEYGIAALAADLDIYIGTKSWQVVVDQIESEIRSLGKSLPSGVPKAARLQFLSEAAKEIVYFKDGWRNYVSHNRIKYDKHQARSVLEHACQFMTVLSAQLSERTFQEQSE